MAIGGYLTVAPQPYLDDDMTAEYPLPVFVPPPVAPGATHLWDAKHLTAATGGSVAAWQDEIGSLTLAAENVANLPVLEREVSGSPSLHVNNGSRQTLTAAMQWDPACTFLAVGQVARNTNFGVNVAFAGAGVAESTDAFFGYNVNKKATAYADGSLLDAAGTVAVQDRTVIVLAVFNGASSVISENGVETTGATGSNRPQNLTLGSSRTVWENVRLKRLIYWPRALTKAERDAEVIAHKALYDIV